MSCKLKVKLFFERFYKFTFWFCLELLIKVFILLQGKHVSARNKK